MGDNLKIVTIELSNGLGDYYNELKDFYIDNALPTIEDEKKFIIDIEVLLKEQRISFSDKLSILNALLISIEREDVWHLIRG